MPIVTWMQANGRPVEDRLRDVDLLCGLGEAPDLPIALVQGLAFLLNAGRTEGPDVGCRVVSGSSLHQLGPLGEVALGARTVREALFRVAAFLPYHATHEVLSVVPACGGVLIREAWGLRMDDETRHLVQQYVAALFQAVCASAGAPVPVFGRVVMAPHPVHGLSHLHGCFGERPEASRDGMLELFVPAEIAAATLANRDNEPPYPLAAQRLVPLRGDGSLSGSVRILTASMLSEGAPTVARLSAAAGLSRRTFQRRQREEGHNFSTLLEEVRRELALADLSSGGHSIGEIAGILGYRQPSSLSPAVRRWTGAPPRAFARPGEG